MIQKADYEKSLHYIQVELTPQTKEFSRITKKGQQRALDLSGVREG